MIPGPNTLGTCRQKWCLTQPILHCPCFLVICYMHITFSLKVVQPQSYSNIFLFLAPFYSTCTVAMYKCNKSYLSQCSCCHYRIQIPVLKKFDIILYCTTAQKSFHKQRGKRRRSIQQCKFGIFAFQRKSRQDSQTDYVEKGHTIQKALYNTKL